MKTIEAFRAHYEGLPNNILWIGCSRAVSGVDYSNCTKEHMAEAFVKDDYGIGKLESMDPIDDKIIEYYVGNSIGPKQSAVVFNWLSREKLLQKMLRAKDGRRKAKVG